MLPLTEFAALSLITWLESSFATGAVLTLLSMTRSTLSKSLTRRPSDVKVKDGPCAESLDP